MILLFCLLLQFFATVHGFTEVPQPQGRAPMATRYETKSDVMPVMLPYEYSLWTTTTAASSWSSSPHLRLSKQQSRRHRRSRLSRLHQSDRVSPTDCFSSADGASTAVSPLLRDRFTYAVAVARRTGRDALFLVPLAPTALVSTTTRLVTELSQLLYQVPWYCFPLSVCLVPAVHQQVWQRPAAMPDFWKTVRMEYIRASPDAALVISVFLLSNIFYFWAAAYLLKQHPLSWNTNSTTGGSSSSSSSVTQQPTQQQTQQQQRIWSTMILPFTTLLVPKSTLGISQWTGLGLWTLTAGLISTLFHSVQATCHTMAAEALCFVDHGVAATSILYFWHVCGRPNRQVTTLSVVGLILLALPLQPGYAWLHSAWHAVSAAAAAAWAQQGWQRQNEQNQQQPRNQQQQRVE